MFHLLNELNYKLTEYAAETMIYFEKHKLIEIAKLILVECAIERPDDVHLWLSKNIKRIATLIYRDCLSQGKYGIINSLHLSAHFLYRVVVFGRPGSGRHTMATYLARRFNLVYLDAEILIYQYLKGDENQPNDSLAQELQRSFYYDNCIAKGKALAGLIARRLLEKDCLTQGWVLFNFPNTLQHFKDILENFKIPPNKVIYLKCPQKICMLRLVNMPNIGKPYNNCSYFEHQMRFFNQQEKDIDDYLLKRFETIYLNSERGSQDVKYEMFKLIEKSPYLMGFKQNTYNSYKL